MADSIYLDTETKIMLKELRQKHPAFNLSEVVRNTIRSQLALGETVDQLIQQKTYLLTRKAQLESSYISESADIINKVTMIDQKIHQLQLEEEIQKKSKESQEETNKQQYYENQLKSNENFIKNNFSVASKEAALLAEEYILYKNKSLDEGLHILGLGAYIEKKGHKRLGTSP